MALKFSALTRSNIRKLNPGASLNEHGITFTRLVNGDGRYSVNVMVDGQRISTGSLVRKAKALPANKPKNILSKYGLMPAKTG